MGCAQGKSTDEPRLVVATGTPGVLKKPNAITDDKKEKAVK